MVILSLLVPTYNRVSRLACLLEYFVKNDVFNNSKIEIIISNNCSNDKTSEVLGKYDYYNLKKYNQDFNIGAIANIRFLIGKATGKYVWIMGDNDFYFPGVVDKVLKCLDNDLLIGRCFVNYSSCDVHGNILSSPVYIGAKDYYENGWTMFKELTERSGLGASMFISANIYLKDVVTFTNGVIDENNEITNLAIALGYSIESTKYPNVCISDVLVADEVDTVSSWKSDSVLVYCRDMIAMYDIIAQKNCNYSMLRDFLIKNLPVNLPEYRYIFMGRRFNKNNYAMRLFYKYYPWKIFIDLLAFPYYLFLHYYRK